MNKDVKDKWVSALRSGEYEQGVGYLCLDGCYCVMGVLVDLYNKEHVVFSPFDRKAPAEEVYNWASLIYLPKIVYGKEFHSLIYLNDIDKLNFEELADLIEEQL